MSQTVKNLPAMWKTQVRFLGWKDPLKKGMAAHSSILAFHGQRSLVGYSPWGCKESDMTEVTTTSSLSVGCYAWGLFEIRRKRLSSLGG